MRSTYGLKITALICILLALASCTLGVADAPEEQLGEAESDMWHIAVGPVGPGGPLISMPSCTGADDQIYWCSGTDTQGELLTLHVCAGDPGAALVQYGLKYATDVPLEARHPIVPAYPFSYGCGVSGFPRWKCSSGSPFIGAEEVVWADDEAAAEEAAARMAGVFGSWPPGQCAPDDSLREVWTCGADGFPTCSPSGGARSEHLAALACAGAWGASVDPADVDCARGGVQPPPSPCAGEKHRFHCWEWANLPDDMQKIHPLDVQAEPTWFDRAAKAAYCEAHEAAYNGLPCGHKEAGYATSVDCNDQGPVGVGACESDGDTEGLWACQAWVKPWPPVLFGDLLAAWAYVIVPGDAGGGQYTNTQYVLEEIGLHSKLGRNQNWQTLPVYKYRVALPVGEHIACYYMDTVDDRPTWWPAGAGEISPPWPYK